MLLPLLLCILILYLLPMPPSAPDGAWQAAFVGVALLAVVNAFMAWAGSALAGRVCRVPDERGSMAAAKIFVVLKGAVVGFVVADVAALGWQVAVSRVAGEAALSGLVYDLVLPLPALVMILTLMAFQHRFERRRGRVSLPLSGYLWLRFRVEMAIVLVPWFILVLATDLPAALLGETQLGAVVGGLASVGVLVAIIVLSPLLLRTVWHTSPLPPGPLRDRLEQLCREHRFRCSNILIWHTHRHLANAGVAGPTPLLRYVMLTDALLQNCTDEEVAAIFAHEVGHIKHGHLPFYLLCGAAFVCFFPNLLDLAALTPWVEPPRDVLALELTRSQATVMLVFAAAYWTLAFGFVSRRMEREADLFALRAMGDPSVFHGALGKLALMSSLPRGLASWRHFSVEERMAFIQQVADDPALADRVERRTLLLKLAVIAALALAAARIIFFRPALVGM